LTATAANVLRRSCAGCRPIAWYLRCAPSSPWR
jgi:hypothetical protein